MDTIQSACGQHTFVLFPPTADTRVATLMFVTADGGQWGQDARPDDVQRPRLVLIVRVVQSPKLSSGKVGHW